MSKRILIIDDEENIRRMTRLTLETAGYEVGEAGDGAQGLNAFGDGSQWDAVLLDQKMPGMDGLETLRRIKERAPDARVIMVTAFATIELAVEAMKLGATDFVRKPMTPQTVRDAVEVALAKQSRAASAPTRAPVAAPAPPLIQHITMNGFSFVRATDVSGALVAASNEHRFVVKAPNGWEREVVVEISDEAVAYVERMTRRRLPPANSFWAAQAERLLSEYLWNEGRLPPGGRLRLVDVELEVLATAARWEAR